MCLTTLQFSLFSILPLLFLENNDLQTTWVCASSERELIVFVVLFTAAGLKDVIHIRSRPYDDTTNDQLLREATDREVSIITLQEFERRNTSREVTVGDWSQFETYIAPSVA